MSSFNTLRLTSPIKIRAAEIFKDWRPRYFILWDNGQFLGFRHAPTVEAELTNPLNNFTVKNCDILEHDRPKRFAFAIKGLQMSAVVVRMFHAKNEEDRYRIED